MAWYRCVGGAGGSLKLRTASGRIATFSTNMVEAFKSLKTDINPVQDLHGYSKPWSGGGGKNKFNDTTGTHTINANTDVILVIGDVYLEANTTYTISCKQTPAPLTSFVRNTLFVVGGGSTTYNPAGNDYTIKPMVFTPTVSGTYSVRVWGHTLSANTTYSQFQVEKGSQATAYEPYSNICPISGFSALNVTRTGKNLFRKGTTTSSNGVTFTVNNDGSVSLSGTATNTAFFIAFADMQIPNGTYTLSGGYSALIAIYIRGSSSGVNILGSTGSPNSGVINMGVITGLIRIQSGTNTDGITLKPQLELGNQASDYTPYNGQTATVNFGQTVYGGVADVTNGKVNVTHGYIDLSSLNWNYNSSYNFFAAGLVDIISGTGINQICTQYESITGVGNADMANVQNNTINHVNTTVKIKDTRYTNASDFRSAMSGVMLCYELATPTEITTTPENLTALSGQTNNVYGDTNGDTTVEYYIEV